MKQDLILITGMSGSGKSVALHALEDAGFYCVDNLPPQLLPALIDLMDTRQTRKVAVAIDVRSADALPQLPRLIADLAEHRVRVKALFLDATTDTLVRRFSETRRRHPLNASEDPAQNSPQRALVEAIELERQMLMDLREHAHVIDTSLIRGQQLQVYVKALFESAGNALTLVFESFGFKKGLPLDADYVFDVRMLPNPYYQTHLKALTGRDPQVAQYLSQDPNVIAMRDQVQAFLTHWLPSLDQDQRSYVTVAIGCTGGQHRSVFLVEQVAAHFAAVVAEQKRPWAVLKRHRELDAAPTNA